MSIEGIGTHDSLLIQILSQRTKDQIEKIDQHYRQLTENHSHKSLFEFLKSECSGDYGTFLKHVAKSRPNFLAKQLSQAMDGNKLNFCFLLKISNL